MVQHTGHNSIYQFHRNNEKHLLPFVVAIAVVVFMSFWATVNAKWPLNRMCINHQSSAVYLCFMCYRVYRCGWPISFGSPYSILCSFLFFFCFFYFILLLLTPLRVKHCFRCTTIYGYRSAVCHTQIDTTTDRIEFRITFVVVVVVEIEHNRGKK